MQSYKKSYYNQLKKNPQKRVICLKVLTIAPKKPNSANRRIVRAKIFYKNIDNLQIIKIPGEKHNLQTHSTILISHGRCHDLIGVRFKAIRGKFDLFGVNGRSSSRSVYGVKKPTI
jgi:small subunit ribosomal protein S12